MGGGKGAKTAATPNYAALAQQQGSINQQAAQQLTQANRPNQYDAFGNSVTWTQTQSPDNQAKSAAAQAQLDAHTKLKTDNGWSGGIDTAIAADNKALSDLQGQGGWEQHQNLSPENKAAWDSYNSNVNKASSSYGDILNKYLSNYQPYLSNYQPYLSNYQQYTGAENDKAVSDALYGSVMDRGAVSQQRETDSLNTQLRNSGLVPGSEAYNRAMQNLTTSHSDANLLAAQNATLAGAQESRNQRNQSLQESIAGAQESRNQRNQSLQELSGMAGIAGGTPYQPTYQGFSGATGYNPTDLVGAAQATYGSKQAGANASNSKKSGLMGAGASLGGSYLGSK